MIDLFHPPMPLAWFEVFEVWDPCSRPISHLTNVETAAWCWKYNIQQEGAGGWARELVTWFSNCKYLVIIYCMLDSKGDTLVNKMALFGALIMAHGLYVGTLLFCVVRILSIHVLMFKMLATELVMATCCRLHRLLRASSAWIFPSSQPCVQWLPFGHFQICHRGEYLYHENWQMLPIRVNFLRAASG